MITAQSPLATSPPGMSSFNVSLMPQSIYRRTLQQYSVHHSMTTGRWIATIAKCLDASQVGETKKCVQFAFDSEREAIKFAKAYSPPKLMVPPSSTCVICSNSFSIRRSLCHCRNCGASVCEKCTTRWGIRMIPKTYVNHATSLTVRVCKTCDWLSNAFCMALLQGKYDDAIVIFQTGNVNLRSTFADINREAMFPVHCAVMGGNLSLLKWLVDTHACPISVKRDSQTGRRLSVQTSAERTLIDLAMTGKPKIDILRFLVMNKNMSIMDTKDPALAPRTLEALLRAGVSISTHALDTERLTPSLVIDETEESVTTIEDACILCYEKSMDCVLIPCGHQVCCQECGKQLTTCPVCKVNCSVLRIFRQ